MHNKKKNQLLSGAMLAAMAPAVSAADIPAWNGSALGFEAGQQGLLGDMLGIRPILEENGFHYNLDYNESRFLQGSDECLAYRPAALAARLQTPARCRSTPGCPRRSRQAPWPPA